MKRTRRRTCDGKIRHVSRPDALAHAAHLQSFGATRQSSSVYHCPYCNGWHVGHKPRPRR